MENILNKELWTVNTMHQQIYITYVQAKSHMDVNMRYFKVAALLISETI